MIINYILYVILIIALFGSLGVLLWKLRVDRFFTGSFVLLSLVYSSVALFEATITGIYEASDRVLYSAGMWLFHFGFINLSFICLYFWHIYSTKQFVLKKLMFFTAMVFGVNYFIGTWFSDFGYFLIKGVHLFNPVDAYWLEPFLWGFFPLPYLQSIPGIILLNAAFLWFLRHRIPHAPNLIDKDFQVLVIPSPSPIINIPSNHKNIMSKSVIYSSEFREFLSPHVKVEKTPKSIILVNQTALSYEWMTEKVESDLLLYYAFINQSAKPYAFEKSLI